MELLRRLEEEIEGAMARVFGSVTKPLGAEALASAILKALESNKVQGLEAAFAPNDYAIYLNPADVSALLSLFDTLSAEVRRFVKELAAQKSYRLTGPVAVRWDTGAKVKKGEANVQARVFSGQPRAALTVVQGAQAGQDFPIEATLTSIGRTAENDVIIADENVSRHHCELRFTGTDFEVEDLGSTNGVILNGQPVTKAIVEDGDTLELGRTLLKFHIRLGP